MHRTIYLSRCVVLCTCYTHIHTHWCRLYWTTRNIIINYYVSSVHGKCRCDNTAHDGHTNIRYKCITSTGFIYKSHWRMDRSLFDFCVRCTTGICTRQLCIAFRLGILYLSVYDVLMYSVFRSKWSYFICVPSARHHLSLLDEFNVLWVSAF